MEQVIAAASLQITALTTQPTNQQNFLEELLEQLRWLLNMRIGATAADITTQLQKLIDTIKQDSTVTAAASLIWARTSTSRAALSLRCPRSRPTPPSTRR